MVSVLGPGIATRCCRAARPPAHRWGGLAALPRSFSGCSAQASASSLSRAQSSPAGGLWRVGSRAWWSMAAAASTYLKGTGSIGGPQGQRRLWKLAPLPSARASSQPQKGSQGGEGTTRSNIKIGSEVSITLKKDQRTGILTYGRVQRILTNSREHPRGIKVRLEDGQVGRVVEVDPQPPGKGGRGGEAKKRGGGEKESNKSGKGGAQAAGCKQEDLRDLVMGSKELKPLVRSVFLVMDGPSKCRGYGFVDTPSREAADKVIAFLDGKDLMGAPLKAEHGRSQGVGAKRGASGGGGGGETKDGEGSKGNEGDESDVDARILAARLEMEREAEAIYERMVEGQRKADALKAEAEARGRAALQRAREDEERADREREEMRRLAALGPPTVDPAWDGRLRSLQRAVEEGRRAEL